MIFLIEYERSKGRLLRFTAFKDSESGEAEAARLELELSLQREGVEHEIVILEAEDEQMLRRTHRRYFESVEELTKPLARN